MSDASDITFNVVFVRGTVAILRAFVHSLHACTRQVRFRLISNGCSGAEAGMLRDLCLQDRRLSFLELSRRAMLPHGVVLNEVHRLEDSAFFAFMDSDCLATADFAELLACQLQEADAVFSGRPVWSAGLPHRLPEGFQRLICPHDELSDGQCAGMTYVAVYDNAVLSECVRQTGVTFLDYRWHEIPRSIQRELAEAGKRLAFYDTGKLINILLGVRGYRCRSVPLPSLRHLGGVSGWEAGGLRRRMLSTLEILRVERLARDVRDLLLRRTEGGFYGPGERRRIAEITARKARVLDYLSAVLRSVEQQRPPKTTFEHHDEKLVAAVTGVESQIRDVHAAWLTATSVPPRRAGALRAVRSGDS